MNKTETKAILDIISAIDNRKVALETIEAWHMIIGSIPYEIAREALKLAQQDPSVKYLEPRHIVGWAKEAAFRLDRDKPKPVQTTYGIPEPTCKHGEKLLSCKPCCKQLYEHEHLSNSELVAYARQNVWA